LKIDVLQLPLLNIIFFFALFVCGCRPCRDRHAGQRRLVTLKNSKPAQHFKHCPPVFVAGFAIFNQCGGNFFSAFNPCHHMERIAIVRQYMDGRGDTRKLFWAVAGAVVHGNVRRYAQKHGLYVLVQSGESVSLAEAPRGFKAAEW
jgi:hypothetical protein